jgi:GNAT superfamily N-acetyltransferase
MTEPWLTGVLPQDNAAVTVRPIRPGDAGLIDEMHRRLSADSVYFRYLQPRAPTWTEIERVCQIHPNEGAGFVATVQARSEIVVGVAYYLRETLEQHLTAEPGILVEDQFQGLGIGRSLWQQMHYHAQANQIRWLRVLFDPSNQRVLRLLQGSGFAYQAKTNYGLSEYLVLLGDRPCPVQTSRKAMAASDDSPDNARAGLLGKGRSAQDRLTWNWTLVPQTTSVSI